MECVAMIGSFDILPLRSRYRRSSDFPQVIPTSRSAILLQLYVFRQQERSGANVLWCHVPGGACELFCFPLSVAEADLDQRPRAACGPSPRGSQRYTIPSMSPPQQNTACHGFPMIAYGGVTLDQLHLAGITGEAASCIMQNRAITVVFRGCGTVYLQFP